MVVGCESANPNYWRPHRVNPKPLTNAPFRAIDLLRIWFMNLAPIYSAKLLMMETMSWGSPALSGVTSASFSCSGCGCTPNSKVIEKKEIDESIQYYTISAAHQKAGGYDGTEIKVAHDGLPRHLVTARQSPDR